MHSGTNRQDIIILRRSYKTKDLLAIEKESVFCLYAVKSKCTTITNLCVLKMEGLFKFPTLPLWQFS